MKNSNGTVLREETVPLASGFRFRPEQLVQGFPQDSADADAQVDRRVVVALFDRADRLARDPRELCQVVL